MSLVTAVAAAAAATTRELTLRAMRSCVTDLCNSSAQLHFDATAGCWVHNTRKLRGVRAPLQRVFYSNYVYSEAEKAAASRGDTERVKTGLRGGGSGRFSAAKSGQRRGLEVHDQVAARVRLGDAQAAALLRQQCKRESPLVSSLFQCFEKMRWTPIGCEMPVYDLRTGFGSSVDIVCINNRNDKLVFIELKVGGDNYYRKSNGFMEGASLRSLRLPNSPLYQAHLQLLAYKCMIEWSAHSDDSSHLRHITPNLVDNYWVVFLGETGVVLTSLDPRLVLVQTRFYEELALSSNAE